MFSGCSFFVWKMAGYQRFIITVGKLQNIEEAKEALKIIDGFIRLNIPAGLNRENQWGFYPAIKTKKSKNYSLEVEHIGFYPRNLPARLSALKRKLKISFREASIKYLNIEKLREI